MATTPEGKVKKAIRSLLDSYADRGELHYDMPVQGGYGSAMLDFHGVHLGRYFVIEAKAPGKKPTDRQLTTLGKIAAAGGKTFVVDGEETLAAVNAWLRRPGLD